MMAHSERPPTLLARVRTHLVAVRAALSALLRGPKPNPSEGGTGGAVG